MSDYCLSCCSAVDLTPKQMEQRNIHYICFQYTVDEEVYADDMGVSMSSEELFERMAHGAKTKTSQISVARYIQYFEPFLKEGMDILHVTLSSGITGTYNSACVARSELLERYPERKIFIVDSLAASSGYGLLMNALADQRDMGKSIEEVYDWAEENKRYLHHWFFSTDLSFYVRGGRISRTAGAVGTMLSICPLLNVDKEGHLIPREKIRGKKKVIQRIVEQMELHAQDGLNYHGKCYISHSTCLEDAQKIAAMIEEKFPNLDGKVEIFPIGTTIGSHTGPGTVALFFWGDLRNN